MNAGSNAVLMAMLGGRGRGGAINGFLNSPNYDEERQKDALMNYGASLMGSQNQNNTTSGAVRQLGERLLGAVLTGYREKGYRDKEKTLGEQWGAITSRNDIPVGATLPVAKPKEGSTGDTAQDAASFEALAGGTAKGIDPDEWQKRFGGATMTPKWGATPSGTYAQQLRVRARELYGDQLDPQVDRRISQLEQYDVFTEPERRMREEDRQFERDRWNEQRQWEREKFGQQMDLQRAQLAATRAASGRSAERGTYDSRLGGYVRPDGGFTPVQFPEGYTPPAKEAEYLPVNSSAINEARSLNEAWNELNRVGKSYDEGFAKYGENGPGVGQGTGFDINIMGADMANRVDPAGTGIRSAISQMSSVIMNQLSGAAVSEMERKRLEGFLPTYKDDEQTLYEKLNGYADYINSKTNAWRDTYGEHRVLSGITPKRFERKRGGTRAADGVPPLPSGFVENK